MANMTQLQCGTWQICLHSMTLCGFSTFSCISMAMHVTAHVCSNCAMKWCSSHRSTPIAKRCVSPLQSEKSAQCEGGYVVI